LIPSDPTRVAPMSLSGKKAHRSGSWIGEENLDRWRSKSVSRKPELNVLFKRINGYDNTTPLPI
jgi:hypothetical protein